MTIKEAIEQSGLSLTEISKRTEVPYRTLQNWAADVRTPPEYVKKYFILEVLNFKK